MERSCNPARWTCFRKFDERWKKEPDISICSKTFRIALITAVSKSTRNPSGSLPLFLTALHTAVKNCSYTISVLDGKSAKAQGRTSWLTGAWMVYIWENIWGQSLKVPSPNYWLVGKHVYPIISSKYKLLVNIPYTTIKNWKIFRLFQSFDTHEVILACLLSLEDLVRYFVPVVDDECYV